MGQETVTYYAIVDAFSSRRRPAGVLRRITDGDGNRRDEAFGRNLAWGHATGRYPAATGELHEITEDEATRIVSRMLHAAAAR
ncbi:MAG: hypothetical protein J2P25_26380 [Nocardiopsaceae bacterium]|nr:hypothetical protein [Nocardiopsaceae bacterium]